MEYENVINIVLSKFGGISKELREDIAQELRMFLIENAEQFREGKTNFHGYLYVCLKRKTINLLKNSRYRNLQSLNKKCDEKNEYLDLIPERNQKGPEQYTREYAIFEYVEKKLTKKDRELINLYYFSNLTYEQIGKTLGVSADTAKRKIDKILTRIRGEV